MREHKLAKATVKRWLDSRDLGEFEASVGAAMTKGSDRTHSQDRAALAKALEENERLSAKLRQAEITQEILGKAYELLHGINQSSTTPDPTIPPALMSAEQYAAWLRSKRL
ncbi:MAG: hypothetical protein L0H31_15340 [Nocardioidaceae bacterium]|nr:hypothetical protein [Nocardioidaceae bacterium]